jgi:hypothetical protein
MKYLVFLIVGLMSVNVLAQKKYIDPNVKVKKGLLEADSKEEVAKTESKAELKVEPIVDAKVEVKPSTVTEVKKESPEIAHYCICSNAIDLMKKRLKLLEDLVSNGSMESDSDLRWNWQSEIDTDNLLIKKLALAKRLEIDEFDCPLVFIDAKKPKDYKAVIQDLSNKCNFSNIARFNLKD